MILFFYGEDNYRLNQKIKALKAKFISASLGDTNLSILDGKSVTYDEIVRQILAMPFLSRTRLVIIENLLTAKRSDIQEKVAEFLKKIPSSTVLVFAEGGKP
ncbi:MAG: polymerase III subunit delta protein, partial [Berkelbacteria bacterium GW2011_GWB1_38_5]